MHEIEVFVLVDENGDYVCTTDQGHLDERYTEDVGSDCGLARRVLRIKLNVELPTPTELTADVPMPAQRVSMKVSG